MKILRCSIPKAGDNKPSERFCIPGLRSFLPVIVFLISLLSGCAGYPLHPEPAPGKDYQLSPGEVLETLDLRDSRKKFMKAVAQVIVNTEEGRYPVKLAILAGKPASVHLEAIPVIGLPNLFLSIHNGTMKVYLPQNGEYYVGPATIANLAPFFPLPLAVPDMVSFLMGCRPDISLEELILKGSSEGDSYRLDILSSENRLLQSLWIDPATLYLNRHDRIGENGERLLSVYFDEYSQADDIPMPRRIRFQMPGRDRYEITLRYEGAAFEPATDETGRLFDLPVPEGVKTIILK